MSKERRLGRGLEALLSRTGSGAAPAQSPPGEGSPRSTGGSPYDLPSDMPNAAVPPATSEPGAISQQDPSPDPARVEIRLIDSNPFQPRQEFDGAELDELAASLRSHGLLQAVAVRRMGDRYQLIAGERRLRAATRAGWTDVPVQIVEADDRQVAELAIIENVQRKDLNPLEKAASFQRYLQEYGCTQEELASRLHLDRSTVANLIRLLELPDAVQDALRQGKITQGHARALLPLGDEREQIAFCRRVQDEGMNVRQTEAAVQETIARHDAEPLSLIGRDGTRTQVRRPGSEHVAALEQEFRAALGLKVKLTHNARGRGKLVIQFANHDDFDRLHEHICGPDRHVQMG